MKKLVLLTLVLGAVYSLKAQDNYSFSQRNANYTEMTGATEVSPSEWDDFTVGVSLPFAFRFFDVAVDTLFIYDDGIAFDLLDAGFITPHGEDPIARGAGQSPVSYRVDGSGSNRILKIQWPNISFYPIADSFPNDFANYQVWLYETTNVIEFHIGSSSISAGAQAELDLIPGMRSGSGLKWVGIKGGPTTYEPYYDEFAVETLSENPSVNTVFVFTPGFPNGILETSNEDMLSIYPVPAGLKLNIATKADMQRIHILNMTGQQISTHEVSGTQAVIDTDKLASGIYLVQVVTSEGVLTRKITK